MAKKKKENDIVTDGSRAITKFHVSDVVMVVILVILCATCVVPFIHLLAKSVSSNTAVLAKRVSFWPIGFNLDAPILCGMLCTTIFLPMPHRILMPMFPLSIPSPRLALPVLPERILLTVQSM